MTNEIPSEQALLTEYQVCQQNNSSSASDYWTLSGIFIGISSVLLAAMIYVFMVNNTLFQVLTIKVIITVLALIIIAVLELLWFWMKRVDYLANRNFERMREIELELGMWKSWRIHSLDKWNELGFKSSDTLDSKKNDQIWHKLKEKLCKKLPEKYLERLEQRKVELVNFCNLYKPQKWYEKSTSKYHYKYVLLLLIVMWVIFIIITWLPISRCILYKF